MSTRGWRPSDSESEWQQSRDHGGEDAGAQDRGRAHHDEHRDQNEARDAEVVRAGFIHEEWDSEQNPAAALNRFADHETAPQGPHRKGSERCFQEMPAGDDRDDDRADHHQQPGNERLPGDPKRRGGETRERQQQGDRPGPQIVSCEGARQFIIERLRERGAIRSGGRALSAAKAGPSGAAFERRDPADQGEG